MKIIYSSIIPFKGFYAMNLFGVLFVRKEYEGRPVSKTTLNHEEIHSAQALDFCKVKFLGYLIFYLTYFIFWILELFRPPYNSAYRSICYEREAYDNENNLTYLDTREKWSAFKKRYWTKS